MRIAYFPEIYPDELIYSLLARFYQGCGYSNYIFCAEDLFINKRARPEIGFINELKPEILQLVCEDMSIERLIEKHTMFPYYARFLPKERRIKGFKALCNRSGDYSNLLAISKQKNGEARYLRYCPLCVKEDRNVYGETYWHRAHQMMGVNFCPKHGCGLMNSSIMINAKASPNLTPAEFEVKEIGNITYGNELEIKLVKYIGEVFQADMAMENDVEAGKFLHSRLYGTKYVSVRGEQRNIRLFADEFLAFYESLSGEGLSELWQMQKIFNGYRFNCFEVCQMAMFQEISSEDLCNMKLPDKSQEQIFDEKVKKLQSQGLKYPEIAKRLNASYNVVKPIGENSYGKYSHKKETHRKCGVKKQDWAEIDKATLPLVKKAIKELQGQEGDRPRRVNMAAVSKILGFPDKRLQLLPKSTEVVMKYYETQEQYWAKEVVWAVNKLEKDGKEVSQNQVRRLTNMRKDNLIASLPHLEVIDSDIAEMIAKLLLHS